MFSRLPAYVITVRIMNTLSVCLRKIWVASFQDKLTVCPFRIAHFSLAHILERLRAASYFECKKYMKKFTNLGRCRFLQANVPIPICV